MKAPKLQKLQLKAENGVKMPALTVFSEAIKFLKHHFENVLEKSMLSQVDSDTESKTNGSTNSKSNKLQNITTPKVTEDRESSWSSDILWVLTVPAIWSDQAKQFMREAAIQVKFMYLLLFQVLFEMCLS